MNNTDAERAIEKRLSDNWATTVIDINPNILFDAPAITDSFIKLDILHEGRERKNIGINDPVRRSHGTIVIRIYTSLNEGTRKGRQYGDTIAALFREAEFDGIKCRQPNVLVAGQYEGRFQTNMIVPFYWDSNS